MAFGRFGVQLLERKPRLSRKNLKMGFFCFAVFYGSKQLRVFSYDYKKEGDRQRAKALALAMRENAAACGYIYTIEDFGLSGVGVTVKE